MFPFLKILTKRQKFKSESQAKLLPFRAKNKYQPSKIDFSKNLMWLGASIGLAKDPCFRHFKKDKNDQNYRLALAKIVEAVLLDTVKYEVAPLN